VRYNRCLSAVNVRVVFGRNAYGSEASTIASGYLGKAWQAGGDLAVIATIANNLMAPFGKGIPTLLKTGHGLVFDQLRVPQRGS